jgi:metal transporter CNNM
MNLNDRVTLRSQAGLRSDDRTLISGAISFSNKTVADVQTKIDEIFMLHIDTVLTFDEIARIYLKGRSRVPV